MATASVTASGTPLNGRSTFCGSHPPDAGLGLREMSVSDDVCFVRWEKRAVYYGSAVLEYTSAVSSVEVATCPAMSKTKERFQKSERIVQHRKLLLFQAGISPQLSRILEMTIKNSY